MYRNIKSNLSFETYLLNVEIPEYRYALFRFRSSSHALNIETGRHFDVPSEHRYCMLCSTGDIEDEFHFLLVCTTLSNLREKCLPKFYCHDPDSYKFKTLLTSENKETHMMLAKYLFLGFKIRRQLLGD